MRSHKHHYSGGCLSLFMLLLTLQLSAQYFPAEGSRLHYRLIGFSVPAAPGVKEYRLEIARDTTSSEEVFEKNLFMKVAGKTTNIRAEVPDFGKYYTWRTVYKYENGREVKNELCHFSTLDCPYSDTANVRLRVIKDAEKYREAFFFSDNTKILYNMKGQPVWFLPIIRGVNNEKTGLRDLKLSPQGTITFLANDRPYEISYDGNLLWQAGERQPGMDANKEHYHHEFTRLNNGNYMVMGAEILLCKLNKVKDSLPVICDENAVADATDTTYRKIPFGSVIEYDSDNKVVWTWYSSPLLREKKLQAYFKSYMTGYEMHTNAFAFDQERKELYVSSKHYSLVVKAKYPSGKLLNIYGDKRGEPQSLFCEQHACKVTKEGNLYLFNNNECNLDEVPSIVMFKQSATGTNAVKKIWEFKFPVERLREKSHRQHIATTGGNVMELPDKSVFASLCSPYSNLFIVSKDKKILWHSILEKKDGSFANVWQPLTQYRAFIVTAKSDIDRMIFRH